MMIALTKWRKIMKRRILAIFLVAALIAAFTAACGKDEPERQPGDPAKALFITRTDAPFRFIQSEFDKLLDEFGIEVDIVAADNGTVAEIDGIERAAKEGYDVIFINSSDITEVVPALAQANEEGLIIGLFSSNLPQGNAGNSIVDFFCGPDYFLTGMTAGEFVSGVFLEGANAVEIGGPVGDTIQTQLHNGFSAGIADNIDLLATQNSTGYFNTNEAREIMDGFLSQFADDINIVWCHSDGIAASVIDATQAAGRTDIFIIGVGGSGIGYRNVRDGLQSLSISQNYTSMVRRSLQNARALLDGGSVPQVNIIPMDFITQDTIDNFTTPDW